MHSFYVSTIFVALTNLATADTHSFFSGFFSGSTIVGLEFDDVTHSLSIIKNISTQADSSKWIALDSQNKNLYVATTQAFQSYAITSDLDLTFSNNITLSAECNTANFILSSPTSPHPAFGVPYNTGCSGLAISVDSSGTLTSTFANITYDSTAEVHGLALSPRNEFIYSADDAGNAVWAHSYDSSTGVVERVQKLDAPEGASPRHLVVHPNGKWVFFVYEESCEVAVFERDTTTGYLTDTHVTYSLIPSSFTNTSSYAADEVQFSIPTDAETSPKYIIASTRSRTTSDPGYISAFTLDTDTGAITEQLFLLPTTGSGGEANAVSPAKFSEEYFAITDNDANFIEVWKIQGSGASVVAHEGLDNGPANAVWYN